MLFDVLGSDLGILMHKTSEMLKMDFERLELLGGQLRRMLDIGGGLRSAGGGSEGPLPYDRVQSSLLDAVEGVIFDSSPVTEAVQSVESAVLDSIGQDLIVFLAASVAVTPLSQLLGVTPILGYLFVGAVLGPHALNVFSSGVAGVELGDFGILFLLFSEGLEVTATKLNKLLTYLPLGIAQLSLTTGVLTFCILAGGAQFLGGVLPLDQGLINVNNPSEALVLALAGMLSTSAFVFPVLKERKWEEEDVGRAATSILLLQDLAVAPLLVLLPFVVGKGLTDPVAITELTLKATLGFGAVLAAGSFILRVVFERVAESRSSETFTALCLLVALGMGAIGKNLGLTDTAGAFAAGVLLANSNYRAQIQADILPFKGILLGVFFMGAGSNFDSELFLREWPTIITGALSLVTIKTATLASAGWFDRFVPTPTHISSADTLRLSLLLAGGGEFAFVVLASAEKLGAIPYDLGAVLTAIVLISMCLTPLLGDIAEAATKIVGQQELPNKKKGKEKPKEIDEQTEHAVHASLKIAEDAVVVCGYGQVGSYVTHALLGGAESAFRTLEPGGLVPDREAATAENFAKVASIVCFDQNPARVIDGRTQCAGARLVYGDGGNAQLIRSCGVVAPRAIVITYRDPALCLSATARLRTSFPTVPIYCRAKGSAQRDALLAVGASGTVDEACELAVQLGAKLFLERGAFQLKQSDVLNLVDSQDEKERNKVISNLRKAAQNMTDNTEERELVLRTLRAVTKNVTGTGSAYRPSGDLRYMKDRDANEQFFR